MARNPSKDQVAIVGVGSTGPAEMYEIHESSGPDGSVAAVRSAGLWVDSPISASGPRMRRASATGASSCPTWTPSAATSSARSGRSLRMKGTP